MNQTASTLGGAASAGHDDLSHKCDATIDRLAEKAHKTVDNVVNSAKPVADRVMETADELRRSNEELFNVARDYVKERPLAAVAIAVGVGYLLGKIVR